MGRRYEGERHAGGIAYPQGLGQRRVRLSPLQRFDKFERFLVAAPLKIMSQARIDSLRKRRLQFVDLFRNEAQSRHVDVWISPALLVVNDREPFSQRMREVG